MIILLLLLISSITALREDGSSYCLQLCSDELNACEASAACDHILDAQFCSIPGDILNKGANRCWQNSGDVPVMYPPGDSFVASYQRWIALSDCVAQKCEPLQQKLKPPETSGTSKTDHILIPIPGVSNEENTPRITHWDHDFGPPPMVSPNDISCSDYHGYNVFHSTACPGRDELGEFSNTSIKKCRSRCDAHELCVSFEHVEAAQTCRLSSSCTYSDMEETDEGTRLFVDQKTPHTKLVQFSFSIMFYIILVVLPMIVVTVGCQLRRNGVYCCKSDLDESTEDSVYEMPSGYSEIASGPTDTFSVSSISRAFRRTWFRAEDNQSDEGNFLTGKKSKHNVVLGMLSNEVFRSDEVKLALKELPHRTDTNFCNCGYLLRGETKTRTKRRKALACPYEGCGRVFKQTGNLNVHIDTHQRTKKFKCPTCHRCFARKQTLDNHRLTHSDVKPFKCKQCGKGFRQSCQLTRHMQSHKGMKPFHCDLCGKPFADKRNVSKHIDRIHKIKSESVPTRTNPAVQSIDKHLLSKLKPNPPKVVELKSPEITSFLKGEKIKRPFPTEKKRQKRTKWFGKPKKIKLPKTNFDVNAPPQLPQRLALPPPGKPVAPSELAIGQVAKKEFNPLGSPASPKTSGSSFQIMSPQSIPYEPLQDGPRSLPTPVRNNQDTTFLPSPLPDLHAPSSDIPPNPNTSPTNNFSPANTVPQVGELKVNSYLNPTAIQNSSNQFVSTPSPKLGLSVPLSSDSLITSVAPITPVHTIHADQMNYTDHVAHNHINLQGHTDHTAHAALTDMDCTEHTNHRDEEGKELSHLHYFPLKSTEYCEPPKEFCSNDGTTFFGVWSDEVEYSLDNSFNEEDPLGKNRDVDFGNLNYDPLTTWLSPQYSGENDGEYHFKWTQSEYSSKLFDIQQQRTVPQLISIADENNSISGSSSSSSSGTCEMDLGEPENRSIVIPFVVREDESLQDKYNVKFSDSAATVSNNYGQQQLEMLAPGLNTSIAITHQDCEVTISS